MCDTKPNIKEIMVVFSTSRIDYFRMKQGDMELEMIKKTVGSEKRQSEPEKESREVEFAPIVPARALEPEAEEKTHLITSPIPGTFYRAPAPGEKPFVHKGDMVKDGDLLCIIEAMKVMNKIEADMAGEILEILLDDSAQVEYGTPLFKLKAF